MVKLEKLVLQGFKSFNKKTAIPLFDGFNSVIGPNASGKTNLTDSLTFVLGTSSKKLRAGRLDQVIFNGGHGRKPAEYATVTLYIDNSSKKIPNHPEKSKISRRVNRQGMSVYRLNDKAVTRQKIIDILRYANIDPTGHNIIQQGEVTNIIERRPRDRRIVIDEVAGVREYDEKKEKSLKELDIAQMNINEINIVLEQKNEFLSKIKSERDVALRYNELGKGLEKLKANLAFTRVKAVEGTLENVNRNLDIKENELKSLAGKVDNFDDVLGEKEKEIKKLEKEIFDKSVNAKLRKEIEDINGRVLKRQGLVNANQREIDRLEDMINTLMRLKDRRGEGIASHAVKAVLNLKLPSVSGTIAKLGKVDSRFETAIDIATGGHLNDIIVENEADAIKGIKYLKENKLGRVRFLPLDRLKPFSMSSKAEVASKMPGVIDFAINLVRYEQKYKKAFEYVLRDALVAENAESAKKIKGLKVVTLDGDLFESGGAIVGGIKRLKSMKADSTELADIKDYEKAKEKLEKEIKDIEKEVIELNKLLEEKRGLEEKESSGVKEIEKEIEKLTKETEEMKRGRKSEYEQRMALDSEVNELKLRKARLEAEYENLMADYEPYKNKEDLVKTDPEKLEREIKKVERQIKSIGLINMKAIEEFDVFKKDFVETKEKVEQLFKERNSIKAMIQKLDEKRKEIFIRTLTDLSTEFNKVFKDLIGGNAELALENPNDTESGLLIKAQPENKRLINIDSMSGGEKVLTALAFLFATLRYRPAPFYILDEIDAALDKENSEKVGDLIKKYSKESQFLLITHNDITARRAERVYGVSMQKGVSQVLGVKL